MYSNNYSLSSQVQEWLRENINFNKSVDQGIPCDGATSSDVFLITLKSDNNKKYILRLFTNKNWLNDEPDLAQHEAHVLQLIDNHDIVSPKLIAADFTGEECGVPAILMTFLQGKIDIMPKDMNLWLNEMAKTLVDIHNIDHKEFKWRYKSWTNSDNLKPPSWSDKKDLWKRAIEIIHSGQPEYKDTFLHRDYHQTNFLWQNGGISGVVDWVNACVGPASVDLAHCRTNLVYMYGPDIADRFLQAYLEISNDKNRYHPYWDLDEILGNLPQPTFYNPWKQFGIPVIEQEVLRQRLEEHLERVMLRF